MIECPIECVRAACPDPDWLEKHETFTLTMTATVSAAITALLSYFLKSRCTKIKCFGLSCTRQPLDIDTLQFVSEPEIVNGNGNGNENENDINVNVNVNVNETV